ncbi:hypothetical protein LJR289_001419 [Pseudoduganella sp. LjRoot289]|uniref:hypothetical protein n=1 Tax=Pseudoduganella sp. LjRoot289 TaxID=3342314 RepID=UPI003ECE366B
MAQAPQQSMLAQAFIITPCANEPAIYFFGLLGEVLFDFFEWLDKVESLLSGYLQAKFNWIPPATCASPNLPIGYPIGTTVLYSEYFVLHYAMDPPRCRGP